MTKKFDVLYRTTEDGAYKSAIYEARHVAKTLAATDAILLARMGRDLRIAEGGAIIDIKEA